MLVQDSKIHFYISPQMLEYVTIEISDKRCLHCIHFVLDRVRIFALLHFHHILGCRIGTIFQYRYCVFSTTVQLLFMELLICHLSTDETQSGHVLGSPEGRSNTLPERGLSPAVVCILRALMHTALLWASCHTQVCTLPSCVN